MSRSSVCVGLTSALLGLTGCSMIRLVERTADEATYALIGNRDEAMASARAEAKEHCKGPVEVIHEGEVVVGQTTTKAKAESSSRDNEQKDGKNSASQTSGSVEVESTTDDTEFRVTFRCVRQPPAPPPPPPGESPPPPMVLQRPHSGR